MEEVPMRQAAKWMLRLAVLRLASGAAIAGDVPATTAGEASAEWWSAPDAEDTPGPERGRLAGGMPELGVVYEVTTRAGAIEIDLAFAGKRAALRWSSARSFEVRVSPAGTPSSSCTALTAEDTRVLEAVALRWREQPPPGVAGLYLAGTVQVLRDWPEALPVCLFREGARALLLMPDGQAVAFTRPAAGTAASAAGVNICDKFGSPHAARYPTAVRVPLRPVSFVESVRVVGSGGCLGRCGRGCLGDGFPEGFNIYTQACFNHDVCVDELGLLALPCALIFPDVVADTLLSFLFPCDAPPDGLP
jgi:hypothetical protein